MTQSMPGKFTLGAAAALFALMALLFTAVATSTGPVEGSGENCEYDVEAMAMSCTPSEEATTPSTPEPTEAFDPARWMPVPAVLHDGTLSRPKNTGPSALMPPMPPIEGFEYGFDYESGTPTSEERPALQPPGTTGLPQTAASHNAGSTSFRDHRIIVETSTLSLPPAAVWFKDYGHGESHQPMKQSRLRIATGPFKYAIRGFDYATGSPQDYIESTNTYISPPWNRLKPFTFEEELEWRNYDPIRFDPGQYDRARVLQIHIAEAKRRARLWAQEAAAVNWNARNVRITVGEVTVIEEPNTVGGPDEFYTFVVGARVTGTADTTEYNPDHPSARVYRQIDSLNAGRAYQSMMKVRVNGRDYPVFIYHSDTNTWSRRETEGAGGSPDAQSVVGRRVTVNGTSYTIDNVIHQVNQDGTIVFGVEGVSRISTSSGCQSGCLPGQ